MSNVNDAAHLLLLNGTRCEVVVENKSYVLVQPPKWVRNDDEEMKVYKRIETGTAVVYVDNGDEIAIFDADIDEVYDSLLGDGLELERVEKMDLEMIDVAWFA
jgi:hypothetical protein